MTDQITARQWELLSAYLDDQVDEKDAARVQQMLADDPSLRLIFDRMRSGKMLLNEMPQQPVPHHFTLTRQMAAQVRRSSRRQVMGYSSLVAMFLLVVTFVTQLFTFAPRLSLGPQAPVMEREAMEAITQSPPPIIVWGQPYGKGGGGGGEPLNEMEAPSPLQATPGEADMMATPGVEMLQESPPALQESLTTPQPGGPILGIRPSEEAGNYTLAPTAGVVLPPATPSEPFVLSAWFAILQGILLAATLVTGILWLVLRRRR
ncbi:MAG: hypothetical protein HPY76_12370 [Anaerolineae bacterium]|nr:hypothetical protein [Anaerolineae bacterium]